MIDKFVSQNSGLGAVLLKLYIFSVFVKETREYPLLLESLVIAAKRRTRGARSSG